MTATWHHHVLSTNTYDISFRATVLCTSVVQVYMRDLKNLLALTNCAGPPFWIFLMLNAMPEGSLESGMG
jgi:hypothetical protein